MTNEVVYNIAKAYFADGTIDWDTNEYIKCLLVDATTTASGSYDPDVTSVSAAVTGAGASVLTGANADASGTVIAASARSVSADNTNNRAVLYINPSATTWTSADFGSVGAVLIYWASGAMSQSQGIPISYHDGGFPVTTNGGDLTVNFAGGSNNEAIYLT